MGDASLQTTPEAPTPRAVLVLDDEPNVLAGLRRALRKEPYDLLCASAADAAFDILHSRAVDIVISDQDMPGMTGTVFLTKVRQLYPETIRFMLTGQATLDVALQAINDNAVSQFFTKPCDHATLAQNIREALEQKEAERTLEQTRQQELELKDRLLSHVSHELRSPLTAIYQFVTLLLDGLAGELTSQQQEYLSIVLRNVNQLQAMVQDLLDCSRTDSGQLHLDLQWHSIVPLVEETLSTLKPTAAAKNIDLIATLPEPLPQVYADPVRLQQVLRNLLENSIKFTPPSGSIAVGAHCPADDPDVLCLTVTDTGCGIRPEDTTRIFERLSQATDTIDENRQGLGLGLYLCRELITRHGGRIWVDSQVGQGSTFYVAVPLRTHNHP
ncbi:MAG: hybrid sensor histidine kinase/response regulator [Candidatus Tectomicrobia bacterium]|nr:hybrid sensor histidine kinase/response regulator [Candidatus Tectomicrobia bacterium]